MPRSSAPAVIEFRPGRPSDNLRAYLQRRNAFEFHLGRARQRTGHRPACAPGCTPCCTHDMPLLTPWEAAALLELIAARGDDLGDVLPAARAHLARVQAAGGAQAGPLLASGALPCPFLSGGRCRIWRSRPMGCVAAVSADAGACRASAAGGGREGWSVPPEVTAGLFLEAAPDMTPAEREAFLQYAEEQREGGVLPLSLALAALADAQQPGVPQKESLAPSALFPQHCAAVTPRPPSDITVESLCDFLEARLGPDARSNVRTYADTVDVLSALGVHSIAQLTALLDGVDDLEVSRVATGGGRMGRLYRLELMLLAVMGAEFLRRHPNGRLPLWRRRTRRMLRALERAGLSQPPQPPARPKEGAEAEVPRGPALGGGWPGVGPAPRDGGAR